VYSHREYIDHMARPSTKKPATTSTRKPRKRTRVAADNSPTLDRIAQDYIEGRREDIDLKRYGRGTHTRIKKIVNVGKGG
jgi:hypothetical protein